MLDSNNGESESPEMALLRLMTHRRRPYRLPIATSNGIKTMGMHQTTLMEFGLDYALNRIKLNAKLAVLGLQADSKPSSVAPRQGDLF